tara:strand:+ start:695 stop:1219 length:525 start_codon:yes stop_codon:yes gene_type:complete
MDELVYEFDPHGGLPPETWVIFFVFVLVGISILVWPKISEFGLVRLFTFGLRGRWIGIIPIGFCGFIVVMHFVMERSMAENVETAMETTPPTVMEGCLDGYGVLAGGTIATIEINDLDYGGVGLHNWQRLLSTVRSEFEIGDPIRIESVEGEIIRVWRPAPGSTTCDTPGSQRP